MIISAAVVFALLSLSIPSSSVLSVTSISLMNEVTSPSPSTIDSSPP